MKGRYVTAAVLRHLEASLTPWEWALLATLRTVRVATAGQLARLDCGQVSARHCRRRLANMSERRLLARLERVVGGKRAGSSGWVYALDVAGQRLTDVGGSHRRPWTPGSRFLAHALAVTELYVRLKEAETAGAVEVIGFSAEPDCWQPLGEAAGGAVLKPDAYLRLGVGEFEDHYFIEVDRATVSPVSLARQCRAYRDAWEGGGVEAKLGVFPQVLFVVPDERRKGVLVDVFGTQPPETWPLFSVTTEDRAVAALSGGQS